MVRHQKNKNRILVPHQHGGRLNLTNPSQRLLVETTRNPCGNEVWNPRGIVDWNPRGSARKISSWIPRIVSMWFPYGFLTFNFLFFFCFCILSLFKFEIFEHKYFKFLNLYKAFVLAYFNWVFDYLALII